MSGWMRDAVERAAWDRLASNVDQRTFAHMWAWEHEQTSWRKDEQRRERVYDHETDGL